MNSIVNEGVGIDPGMAHSGAEQWIGFDLDDVVANLRDLFVKSMNQKLGVNIQVKDWLSYDHFQSYMSAQEFLQLIVDDRILETCEAEPGAISSIQRLQAKGYKVAIVTARGYHPRGRQITEQWFSGQGLKVDSLQLVEPGQSKVDALSKLPNLVGYVDDHIKHLESITKGLPHVNSYLMTRPWNQHEKRFERVFTVSEYAEKTLCLQNDKLTKNESMNRMRP